MNSLSHAVNALEQPDLASRWYAKLELQFQQSERACRLSRCRHQGPLYVQKPFYPEGRDLAHMYLLHPPGGLVSGDCLQIDVDVEANARALITTPGAGRVYRAREDKTLQQQKINLQVGEGGSLEWLPLETIVYRGAHAQFDTRIDLAPNSHFVGWEVTSLGLPASGVAFDRGQLRQRLQVTLNGQPRLIENLLLNEKTQSLLTARAGLNHCPINGFFVAGPFTPEQVPEALIELCREQLCRERLTPEASQCLAAISLTGDFLVARYLGHCSEEARTLFAGVWSLLRPVLLNRPACPPRIWAT